MNVPRVYSDTSVIGGCLDPEFAEQSLRFIDQVRGGRIILLVSELLVRELTGAPPDVRAVLENLPVEQLENVVDDEEVAALRDAYLDAGVLSRRWEDDATHGRRRQRRRSGRDRVLELPPHRPPRPHAAI